MLAEIVPAWSMAPVVARYQAMRGVDFINAVTVAAEVGDLRRFGHPRELMAYLGLVPTERSTGESRRQGGITKTGNTRPYGVDRGILDVSLSGRNWRGTPTQAGGGARSRAGHRLARPGPPVRPLSPADGARQAAHGCRHRDCARTGRLPVVGRAAHHARSGFAAMTKEG